MKRRQHVLVAIFVLLLFCPVVVFQFTKGFLDTTNYENRELVSLGDVADAPLEKKPLAFQEYFNDHLPFKNQLVGLNSAVSLKLFKTTASPLVVVGADDWMFFNNIGQDNPIDDVIGATAFTPGEMAQIAANIDSRKSNLESRGIEFYLTIAPNKENIYAEYLPGYILERAQPQSRTDLLADYLLTSGTEFSYAKPELLAAKPSQQVYYKYDTHWNELGGYIGTRALFADMGIELAPLSGYTISAEPGAAPSDLSDLAAISGLYNDDCAYTLEGFAPGVSYTVEDVAPGVKRSTSNAADTRTVLIFGDSYFNSMEQYVCRSFGEVVWVNRNTAAYDAETLIAEYEPDIVVLQIIERSSSVLLHDDILQ